MVLQLITACTGPYVPALEGWYRKIKEIVVWFTFSFSLHCRQLEAIIRMSESLAKMKLKPFASDADVDEALRLFQVSTLDAAMSGNLSGMSMH